MTELMMPPGSTLAEPDMGYADQLDSQTYQMDPWSTLLQAYDASLLGVESAPPLHHEAWCAPPPFQPQPEYQHDYHHDFAQPSSPETQSSFSPVSAVSQPQDPFALPYLQIPQQPSPEEEAGHETLGSPSTESTQSTAEHHHSLRKQPARRGGRAAARRERAASLKESAENSTDARCKREKLLQRNREAAVKCRRKKKAQAEVLHTELLHLTTKRLELSSAKDKLRNDLVYLKSLLLMHFSCECSDIRSYLGNTVLARQEGTQDHLPPS